MMIYLLTAIGLTPGGSSTVHIYTQTIHGTTQLIGKIAGLAPSLRALPWHLPFTDASSYCTGCIYVSFNDALNNSVFVASNAGIAFY
jgi:hypothetical protein